MKKKGWSIAKLNFLGKSYQHMIMWCQHIKIVNKGLESKNQKCQHIGLKESTHEDNKQRFKSKNISVDTCLHGLDTWRQFTIWKLKCRHMASKSRHMKTVDYLEIEVSTHDFEVLTHIDNGQTFENEWSKVDTWN